MHNWIPYTGIPICIASRIKKTISHGSLHPMQFSFGPEQTARSKLGISTAFFFTLSRHHAIFQPRFDAKKAYCECENFDMWPVIPLKKNHRKPSGDVN